MNILVIGSGGREHAIIWKMAQSRRTVHLYCAPGNPGIGHLARCVSIKPDDLEGLKDFAIRQKIDLTVVGPEQPLSRGIVDRFEASGLRIVGPGKKASEIESSKVFAKSFMFRHGIPTAGAHITDNHGEAIRYIKKHGAPLVVKADGLAAGKGVVVARTETEAIEAIDTIMREKVFGDAGNRVLLEDCLEGDEVSFLVITDGLTILPMASAQDHKRIFDQDRGPNTGGMGAYSPSPIFNEALQQRVLQKIIRPTVDGLAGEDRFFRGILYAGLMITQDGPMVLEFNARFGDPETQVILPRLESDLVTVFEAVAAGTLDQHSLQWSPKTSVCVVLTSKGYPASYETGRPITGVEESESNKGVIVFHAGTSIQKEKLVTAGGRVLGVTASGENLKEARDLAYHAIGEIQFNGMHYRQDIGLMAI